MASTLLSPGVEIQERDLTVGSIETVEVNVGAIAGSFAKGPVLTPVRISNESQLIEIFGEPSDANAETWWTAASFLSYGGVLDVVRCATSGQLSASDDGTTSPYLLSITTKEVYEATYLSATANPFHWAAKDVGADGNAIRVSVIDKGADTTLVLDGALTTSTIGTQVQNTLGTKSGYIYAWDAASNTVSLITSDVWTTSDVVENGVTDRNISSVSDWYDNQEVWTGFKWSQIAPRPGTSPYVAARGGANDEMHIAVWDATGVITGTPNTLLEKFSYVSKANNGKTQEGAGNYYPNVILNKSAFVYWGSHETTVYDVSANQAATGGNIAGTGNAGSDSATTFDLFASIYVAGGGGVGDNIYVLAKGAETGSASSGEIITGLQEFADTETVQIDYLLMGPGDAASKTNTQAIGAAVLTITSNRKDCVGFLSPYRGDVVGVTSSTTQTSNVVDFYSPMQATSFGVFDNGWKYVYDRFADKYRYIPCNGDVAGLCAATTANGLPWFSPAGLNRGAIKNAVKLAYSPTKSERDTLYQKRINPITSLPGQGILLFGDKTALASPSAFDRINVRRLFNVIEKTIGNAAKGVLFELNDEFTRNNFKNVVEPYLRGVQAERGITDFLVICDDTNNTGAIIDANEFKADFYIKPARSINFITLTFIATRTGVSFEEVIPRR
tara:strand:+ start:1237 stop:3252 length:2016 start_codon:yes stop_codon:yes gene_type:complete